VFIPAVGSIQTVYADDPYLKYLPSTGTLTANIFSGVASQANYADLAEAYAADAEYPPGTVLEFGGEHEVTISSSEYSTKVAGVVSTNPAYLMNSNLSATNVAVVALQGRVPVNVIGPVGKGDMLVSAGNGYAQVGVNPPVGSVLGKSLNNFTFTGNAGTIEIAVGRD
jgi:hypothetical protein